MSEIGQAPCGAVFDGFAGGEPCELEHVCAGFDSGVQGDVVGADAYDEDVVGADVGADEGIVGEVGVAFSKKGFFDCSVDACCAGGEEVVEPVCYVWDEGDGVREGFVVDGGNLRGVGVGDGLFDPEFVVKGGVAGEVDDGFVRALGERDGAELGQVTDGVAFVFVVELPRVDFGGFPGF